MIQTGSARRMASASFSAAATTVQWRLARGLVREVPQALADPGQLSQDRDAQLPQVGRGADARTQQDGWGAVGAGAQHHLPAPDKATGAGPDPDRAAVLDHHPVDQDLGHQGQIRSWPGRGQVGEGGVHPHPGGQVLAGAAAAAGHPARHASNTTSG